MAEDASPELAVAPEETAPSAEDRPVPELLEEGSKLLATQKFGEAADTFSKAVERLTAQHGELAPEVADALVLYGRALLRYAVSRSGVFGGGPAKQAAQEGGTAALVPVAGSSNDVADAAPSRNFHFGGDDPEDEQVEEEAEEPAAEEDPEDDLETAFGVLDQAKVIYQKIEGTEAKLKLAETHDAIGEVLTESEKFEDAVVEFQASLDILQPLLEPHDRRIAEAHLMVALALEYVPVEAEKARKRAIEHAEKSKAVLQLKLELLRSVGGEEALKEVKDIEEVMADLELKIDDLKTSPIFDAQTEKDKALGEALGKPQLDASAPRNDLSGLVKKKKKPASEPVATSNGISGPHGAVNGHGDAVATEGRAERQPDPVSLKRKAEDVLNGAAVAVPAGGQTTVVVGGTAEAHEYLSKRARIDPGSTP